MNLDIQLQPDPYLNLGFHLDHRNGRIELHFPLFWMAVGNVNNIEMDWSLKRFIQGKPNRWVWDRDSMDYATVECHECGHVWELTGGVLDGCPNCGIN